MRSHGVTAAVIPVENLLHCSSCKAITSGGGGGNRRLGLRVVRDIEGPGSRKGGDEAERKSKRRKTGGHLAAAKDGRNDTTSNRPDDEPTPVRARQQPMSGPTAGSPIHSPTTTTAPPPPQPHSP